MSDATLTGDAAVDEHDGEDHDHASDGLYIRIAVILGIITALEISWPYIVDNGPILMVPLLVMMAIKFVLIAAFFMHLKFDSPVLTRVFYFGLILAVGVYVIALVTFEVFRNW